MDAFSPAGVIGAVLGLIAGWLDYRIVGGWVEKKLRETDRSQTPEEKADYEYRIGLFRRFFLIAALGTFSVVGYVLGQTIAG